MSINDDIQKAIDSLGMVDREITSVDAPDTTNPVQGKDEYEWYQSQVYVPSDRRQRLGEYEEMNDYPEIASALDIYADDSTQENSDRHRIEIIAEDDEIKKELERLYFDALCIDSRLWEIVRTTCLYGDGFYETILAKDRKSVVGLKWLPPKTMFRVEENGKLRGFLQEVPQGEPTKFMPFEITHFKLLSTVSMFNPYGTSVLEAARRTWRQLKLMEDAMVVYRVSRAPERRVFKVYTGNLPPAKAQAHIEHQRKLYRKRPFVNQKTGQIDYRANSMAPDEDFWVPVNAAGNGTEIDTLPGAENLGEIDDVKYFKDKIFATLKIPRIWLQDVEGSEERRQNLSQQDIRFSRTIERVQSQIAEGLKKIAIVHLLLRGYKKAQLDDFEIRMTPPSNINETIEAELLEMQARAADAMYQFGFSKKYITDRMFAIPPEEWEEIYTTKLKEESAAMEGGDPYGKGEPQEGGEEGDPFGAEEDQFTAFGGEGDQAGGIDLQAFEQKVAQQLYRRFLIEGELEGAAEQAGSDKATPMPRGTTKILTEKWHSIQEDRLRLEEEAREWAKKKSKESKSQSSD